MLDVVVTAEEPLALGVSPESGNVIDSWAYVPGSVLRGALAAAWIASHGPPPVTPAAERDQFLRLFEGEIRYGPLLADKTRIEPLSVRRCKYQPQRACWDTSDDLAADKPGRVALVSCPVCGGPLAPGKGAVVGMRLEEVTRTALEPDETAKDGNLFSRRQISARTTLRGLIVGDDAWFDEAPECVWLGGRRSTGGRARLSVRRATPAAVEPREDGKILLRLEAPGIFVDSATRPSLEPPLHELSEVLDTQLKIDRRWARPVVVRGWHAASGLPKPADHALAAGSTFLLTAAPALSADGLGLLARRGVGLRRAEGFGHVAVNPPPWTPPERAAMAEERSRAHSLVAPLLGSGQAGRLRPWLLPHLKALAEARELDQPASAASILDERRLRGLAPSVVEAVRELLALLEPDLLRDVIVLLEDPTWS